MYMVPSISVPTRTQIWMEPCIAKQYIGVMAELWFEWASFYRLPLWTFTSSEIVCVSSQFWVFWTFVWESQESLKSQRFSWLGVVGNVKPFVLFALGLLGKSSSLQKSHNSNHARDKKSGEQKWILVTLFIYFFKNLLKYSFSNPVF